MPVFTKKFINFLFLHIKGQKFNTILVSCCTLKEKIVYQSTFKKKVFILRNKERISEKKNHSFYFKRRIS